MFFNLKLLLCFLLNDLNSYIRYNIKFFRIRCYWFVSIFLFCFRLLDVSRSSFFIFGSFPLILLLYIFRSFVYLFYLPSTFIVSFFVHFYYFVEVRFFLFCSFSIVLPLSFFHIWSVAFILILICSLISLLFFALIFSYLFSPICCFSFILSYSLFILGCSFLDFILRSFWFIPFH